MRRSSFQQYWTKPLRSSWHNGCHSLPFRPASNKFHRADQSVSKSPLFVIVRQHLDSLDLVFKNPCTLAVCYIGMRLSCHVYRDQRLSGKCPDAINVLFTMIITNFQRPVDLVVYDTLSRCQDKNSH